MKNSLVYLCLFVSFLHDDIFGVERNTAGANLYPPRSCPAPSLKNGKVKRRQRGRFVKFVCNPGYLLAGERYSTCVQGKWDPLPPKCVRPTCKNKVQPPANGLIYPSHSMAALHFFCKAGYELRGPSDIYCDGWKWDNNVPTCFPTHVKPKLFCDFETPDICSWSHDVNHDFDWRRENYNTPSGSIGTGPSFDHTKGPGQDGYYMYIESSSRNENDTARLISPIFDKTNMETCLEFFYHMFGATTGTLNVYLKKSSEDWSLKHSRLIFSKRGNQGDRWYRSYHSLGSIEEDYQIVIEGIRGTTYVSDIAIDDVRIIENCVYEDDFTSTSTDASYSTEALPTVESCENRCGLKAFRNETHHIPCDCHDECYFKSTCCPDYLDFCLTGSTTEDYSTTEVFMANSAKTTLVAKSSRTWDLVTKKLLAASTIIPTTNRTFRLKSTSSITTKKSTIKPNLVTRKLIILPTIEVLKPPTTPKIIRKVLPTTAITRSTEVKPLEPNEEESNDILEIPIHTDSDQTTAFYEEYISKEHSSEEIENHLHGNYVRNFSESDKLFSQKMPANANYNVVLIVVSVVGIVALTTAIAFFVIRRFQFSRRRMNCSNGDSQSDVRFLTNDEVLDFSLDRNYDEL